MVVVCVRHGSLQRSDSHITVTATAQPQPQHVDAHGFIRSAQGNVKHGGVCPVLGSPGLGRGSILGRGAPRSRERGSKPRQEQSLQSLSQGW